MKKFFLERLTALVLCIIIVFNLGACASKDLPKQSQPVSESTTGNSNESESTTGNDFPVSTDPDKVQAEFSKFCTDYFKEIVTDNLIDFHYYIDNPSKLGITEYNKTFGDTDIDSIFDTTELEKMKTELEGFRYDSLTPTQQQTYDIIYKSICLDIEYSDYALYPHIFGESFGVQSNLPVLLAEYKLRNENDVIEYLGLIETMPDYYKSLMEIEQLRVKKNLAMSDQLVNGIISQCKAFIEKPEENYLIETFDDRLSTLEGIDDTKKQEYKDKNKKIVLEKVIPAYQYLIDEFTKLLGKGKATGGITNYLNSSKYFEYFLKTTVGTEKTPDEINALLKTYSFNASLTLATAMYKDDTILNYMEEPPYPVTEPSAIVEDLKKKITNDFPTVPEVTCKLHTVHPSLSEFLSPAFYISSPVDNSSIQNIYINNGANNSFSGLYPTIAHEGYPGHLYQHLYYSNTEHELIRDVMSFTGYSEGWATYVEMISYSYAGVDMNLATALAAYNVYSLCLYGQMDLGINYYGWTKETLADFVYEHFETEDDELVNDLYGAFLEKPGNYLNYILGYIEIMELKKTATSELGTKFNLKEFHKFLLDFGDAPFYIIEDYMKKWIETQKK